jgi:hypothetical protein
MTLVNLPLTFGLSVATVFTTLHCSIGKYVKLNSVICLNLRAEVLVWSFGTSVHYGSHPVLMEWWGLRPSRNLPITSPQRKEWISFSKTCWQITKNILFLYCWVMFISYYLNISLMYYKNDRNLFTQMAPTHMDNYAFSFYLLLFILYLWVCKSP